MPTRVLNCTKTNRPSKVNTVKSLTETMFVLRVFMRAAGCPKYVVKSYLLTIRKRLECEGHGFLSLCRGFPVIGLRVLGGDTTSMRVSGLKYNPGRPYPRLLSWFYSRLCQYSTKKDLSRVDILHIRKILSVLSFASMLTIKHGDTAKRLAAYRKTVTREINPRFSLPVISKSSCYELLDMRPEDFVSLPKSVDFDNISFRPSSLGRIPLLQACPGFEYCFFEEFEADMPELENLSFGKVTLLDEPGGKVRAICAYSSPFVHSNGLFTRARRALDLIPQDVSKRQELAREYLVKASYDDRTYISGDLSSFTDNITEGYIDSCLEFLDLKELKAKLFGIPVDCEIQITPTVLLMGLKGCFEIGSLSHHLALREFGIRDYRLCCDDIVTPAPLALYTSALEKLGPKLNRLKTVVSPTVVTFCGMTYFRGYHISPCKARMSKIFSRKAELGTTLDTLRDILANIAPIFGNRVTKRIANYSLSCIAYGTRYKGDRTRLFVKYLPSNLGGLGLKKSKSILKLLGIEDYYFTANKSVGVSKPKPEFNRWFSIPIEIMPSTTEPVFWWTPSLLRRGSVLGSEVVDPKGRLCTSKIKIEDILEWMYFGKRVVVPHDLKLSDIYES